MGENGSVHKSYFYSILNSEAQFPKLTLEMGPLLLQCLFLYGYTILAELAYEILGSLICKFSLSQADLSCFYYHQVYQRRWLYC